MTVIYFNLKLVERKWIWISYGFARKKYIDNLFVRSGLKFIFH